MQARSTAAAGFAVLAALATAPAAVADGTQGDDALVVTQGATNPAGTSTSATIGGIAAPVLVTALEPGDALALDGRGGQDTLDASSVLPGAFELSFTD